MGGFRRNRLIFGGFPRELGGGNEFRRTHDIKAELTNLGGAHEVGRKFKFVSPEFRRKWPFPPKDGLFKFVRTTPNGVRRRFRLNTKPARSCTELHEVRREWPKIRGKITEFGRFRSSSCTKTHEKPPPLNPKIQRI